MSDLEKLSCDHIDASPVHFDGWRESTDDGDPAWNIAASCVLYCDHCDLLWNPDSEEHADREEPQDCPACGREADDLAIHTSAYEPIGYSVSWPLGDRFEAPDDWPILLRGTNTTIVEFGGSWYLALTGCGADLSWEICAAYIALGYLPPFALASSLPRLAWSPGEIKAHANTAQACERTIAATAERAASAAARLSETMQWLRDRGGQT